MGSDGCFESVGDALVFRAGLGEWFNQPHQERWDMGEDVAELPPSPWHVALTAAVDAVALGASQVVVDVSEMDWLVGQDWGYLLKLSRRLATRETSLAVLASTRVVGAARCLGLQEHFGLTDSMDDLLGGERGSTSHDAL